MSCAQTVTTQPAHLPHLRSQHRIPTAQPGIARRMSIRAGHCLDRTHPSPLMALRLASHSPRTEDADEQLPAEPEDGLWGGDPGE